MNFNLYIVIIYFYTEIAQYIVHLIACANGYIHYFVCYEIRNARQGVKKYKIFWKKVLTFSFEFGIMAKPSRERA